MSQTIISSSCHLQLWPIPSRESIQLAGDSKSPYASRFVIADGQTGSAIARAAKSKTTMMISTTRPMPTMIRTSPLAGLNLGYPYSSSRKYMIQINNNGSATPTNSTPRWPDRGRTDLHFTVSQATKPHPYAKATTRTTLPASLNAFIRSLLPTTARTMEMKIGKRKKCSAKRIALVHLEFLGPVSPDCPLLQTRSTLSKSHMIQVRMSNIPSQHYKTDFKQERRKAHALQNGYRNDHRLAWMRAGKHQSRASYAHYTK